jgi:radical SAM superfamily enzyme YgiQ (UPF0313 family)
MGEMTTTESSQTHRVGLVQINNSFSNQNYLPLAIGMLQAYAQQHLKRPEDYRFLLPLYRRLPVEDAVQHLLGADVALFSTYVWNFRISLEIARTLKERVPDTVIAFGGPHVPDRVEDFIRQHPYIDLACHGEGEQTAVAILESLDTRNWDGIPGVSFLREDGTLVRNPKGPRLIDLTSAPSPYLQGTFDRLMEANPSEHWIALWETNRGCPFSCTFCDWGSAVQSKVYSFEPERLYQETDWFAEHEIEFIFCCDANFGILPRDLDIVSYVATTKKRTSYPNALSVQNTKNATERAYQVQKILAEAGLNKGVDIALQSMDKNTLESIKRANISSETYQELQRRFTRDGIETYTDVILALPGETYDTYVNGVSKIIGNGQHNRVQFNNLSILPNAEMGDPEYQKKYGMLTVEVKAINLHGSLIESADEIYETQVLVTGTNSMSKNDWVRARAFSWMIGLLHFDKVLQLPLIVAHEVCDLSYRELVEEFLEGSLDSFPVLREVHSFFVERASDMQNGGPELVRSEEWLNIWWPADEYILIKLCMENKLDQFYSEAEGLLNGLLRKRTLSLPADLLHEAVRLNRALVKLPFQMEDLDLDLSYNIWEFYRSSIAGRGVPLENKNSRYHIDRTTHTWSSWDDWCREVIWYGNKKGAYLYGSDAVEPQLAGHH